MIDVTQIRWEQISYEDGEKCLLASLLLATPARAGEFLVKLGQDDFAKPENKIVFSAMRDVYLETPGLDVVVLKDRLRGCEEFKEVGGGEAYLDEIAQSQCSDANLKYYVGAIKQKTQNRKIIDSVNSMCEVAVRDCGPEEKVAEIQRLSLDLTQVDGRRDVCIVSHDAVDVHDKLFADETTGLETGFDVLDWHLPGGLRGGNLVVVGARPSHGKTAFAVDIALNMAKADKSVLIFSLEMSKDELIERMLANIARVNLHTVKKKLFTDEDAQAMADALCILAEYKLYILDTSTLTPEELLGHLKMARQRYGIECVIVDYLQLMTAKGKAENRQQEITAISRGLKAAAKSEEVPFIVLTQLNRQVENRATQKPVLSDIRESGSIEQDADVVILLHRPDKYHEGESGYTPTGNGVFQIAKSRNGPTGEFELKFIERYASFSNISKAMET